MLTNSKSCLACFERTLKWGTTYLCQLCINIFFISRFSVLFHMIHKEENKKPGLRKSAIEIVHTTEEISKHN